MSIAVPYVIGNFEENMSVVDLEDGSSEEQKEEAMKNGKSLTFSTIRASQSFKACLVRCSAMALLRST